jgi:energy-coupling factor transporter ATP-binding protein EcfA2
VIDRLQIRMADEDSGAASLAGRRRRKPALARGLVMQPRLLILDKPLKGLDPAAAADVQALIHERAALGVAVLWVSAAAQELLRVCDRALVMCEGEIPGVLHAGGPEWCEENLLAYATGMRRHGSAAADEVTRTWQRLVFTQLYPYTACNLPLRLIIHRGCSLWRNRFVREHASRIVWWGVVVAVAIAGAWLVAELETLIGPLPTAW